MEKCNAPKDLHLGGGAQFWGYISGQNNTPNVVTKWKIKLEHTTSDWMGEITSDNPMAMLQTPGMFGTFNVTVTASGPNFKEKKLEVLYDPKIHYRPDIACSPDNAGMIGIVAAEDEKTLIIGPFATLFDVTQSIGLL